MFGQSNTAKTKSSGSAPRIYTVKRNIYFIYDTFKAKCDVSKHVARLINISDRH